MDNGSPWGDAAQSPYTRLTVWLLHLDIAVSHGRAYHPQTQGKIERLHRTLQAELLAHHVLSDLPACQLAFDTWRELYNLERPHEALGLQPPIVRFQPSDRPFPETLPPLLYPSDAFVRKVNVTGRISFRNRPVRIGKAFQGYPVGLSPDPLTDGLFHVFFGRFEIAPRPAEPLWYACHVSTMSPNTCQPCLRSHTLPGRAREGLLPH